MPLWLLKSCGTRWQWPVNVHVAPLPLIRHTRPLQGSDLSVLVTLAPPLAAPLLPGSGHANVAACSNNGPGQWSLQSLIALVWRDNRVWWRSSERFWEQTARGDELNESSVTPALIAFPRRPPPLCKFIIKAPDCLAFCNVWLNLNILCCCAFVVYSVVVKRVWLMQLMIIPSPEG